MNYTTLISVASALAAIISAIYAAARVRAVRKQLQQVSSFNLTTLSNQHNWHLLDQRKILPPALPTWAGLTDDGWTWRTLHLNHLNLLKYAYYDHKRKLVSQQEFESWVMKAKFWFRDLWSDSLDPRFREGRERLRELLRPEEGYETEFRHWMVERQIVPSDLVSDFKG